MGFALTRLDAAYAVPFTAPALELVGAIPDLIQTVYQTFAERYPTISPSAFKVLPSNTLSEVGLAVTLLEGRVDITVRVDQFHVSANNLHNSDEVAFAQDCAFWMYSWMIGKLSKAVLGDSTFRVSSWLAIEGGTSAVQKSLDRVARPARVLFDPTKIGAQTIEYASRILLTNDEGKWRFSVAAEPSIVQGADLNLLREYAFEVGGEHGSLEQQLAFVNSSTVTVCEWLGIGSLSEQL